MPESGDHGPRLSGEEYDRRIVALHSGLPPAPTKEQEQRVRRAELELAVAHRLGRDFPSDRIDALWEVLERVEARRGRLLFWHLLRRLWPAGVEHRAAGMRDLLISEFGKVLTPDELARYFKDEAEGRPGDAS